MSAASLLDEFLPKLKVNTLMPYSSYEGTVYHYTSLENINSILLRSASACLWASRDDCLNDVSEGTLPKLRFKQACERLSNSGKISDKFLSLIKNVPPNHTKLFLLSNGKKLKPVRGDFKRYIVSFSEDQDALAMWNYYSKGAHYEGMNIGIDIQSMRKSLLPDQESKGIVSIHAAKVIYDEESQIDIIERSILELSKVYTDRHETSVRYCIGTLLFNLCPVFKHHYFAHEKEVRLFVDVLSKSKNEVPLRYRTNAGFVIPYIEFDFDKDSVGSITLGPSMVDECQKVLQQGIVREMLVDNGYQLSVGQSMIPVRF